MLKEAVQNAKIDLAFDLKQAQAVLHNSKQSSSSSIQLKAEPKQFYPTQDKA
jgi:hypothetical protein